MKGKKELRALALFYKATLDGRVREPLRPIKRTPTFRVPGVYPFRKTKWRVQVRIRGKVCHCGYFDSFSRAIVAFNLTVKENYGSLKDWWEVRRKPSLSQLANLSKPRLVQAPILPSFIEERSIIEALFPKSKEPI